MASAPERTLSGLEAFLDNLPTPLLLIEPADGIVFYANRAAHRFAGGEFPTGGPISQYDELYHCYDAEGKRIPGEQLPGVRIARGETIEAFQIDWDLPDGRRCLIVSGGPVAAPDGRDVGVLTFEDVTDIQGARRNSELLAQAGATLALSLDLGETLRAIARLCVPRFADWCFVEMLQDDGSIERTVIQAADPAKHALANEFNERYPLDPEAPFGSPQVIRTGEPVLVPEIPMEVIEQIAIDEGHVELMRRLDFRSTMIVPLRVGGKVIGDLALSMSESGRQYGPAELETAQQLADRCALFIENARLYTDLRALEASQREARGELFEILEGVADAITAQDPTGRIVYANQAAAEQTGFASPAEMLAAPPGIYAERFVLLNEDGSPLDFADLPGRRALRGEVPEPLTLRWRPSTGGEDRIVRLKARPVFGEDGAVRLAINVVEDITEVKRAEEAQRFLAEASRLLAESLDYEATLKTVAGLAVPHIADWCVVDLKTEHGFERVAAQHSDPEKLALTETYGDRWPPDPDAPIGVPAVLRTGKAELYPVITDEMLVAAARDDEHLRVVRELGMTSAMIVPMQARSEVVGAITMISAESRRHFTDEDVALAGQLGQRAATAVDAARLYRQRSTIAQTLQASLLPPELPEIEGIESAAVYQAAGDATEVGGDFYDVFSTAEDQWFVVVGDVCGKGAEAAAVTALARYTIRAAAVRRRSPTHVLRWLNDAMQRGSKTEIGRFVTIALLRIDLGEDGPRVTGASGGHPLPRIVRADGSVERFGTSGTLIGVVPDIHITDATTTLAPGDSVVLFTDGLSEAAAPDDVWSPEQIDEALRDAAGAPDIAGLVERLVAAAVPADRPIRDDVAVLALRAR